MFRNSAPLEISGLTCHALKVAADHLEQSLKAGPSTLLLKWERAEYRSVDAVAAVSRIRVESRDDGVSL